MSIDNIDLKKSEPKPMTPKKSFWYWFKLLFKIGVWAHIILVGVIAVIGIIYINHNPPYTPLMFYREGWSAKQPTFIPLHTISKTFQLDLINLEDGQFRKHHGIDIKAIKRARELNKKLGYNAFGASTLTQQIARTLLLTPHKNYFRKYIEMLIALEWDFIMGKDRILELYINYAELGSGVYGFGNAALHYYKTPFLKTSTDQKMRLMTILASPINYNPKTLFNNRQLAARYRFLYKYHRYHK